MTINYNNVKYSYLKINSKIKNEFSSVYNDKYLNDTVYVINSNLIRQSFLRRKHLMPWWFVNNSKNVSIYKEFINKWDIFNVYPLTYTKEMYNKRLLQERFYYLFYKKRLKSKRYSEFSFKHFRNNFKYLIKWRNKQRFSRIYSFYKVFRQVRKFWKRGVFVTYNGHVFSMNRRFMRLKKSYVFFRGNLKNYYKHYLQIIKHFFNLIKKDTKEIYTTSKLIIYYSYLLYLSVLIRSEFNKLKKARLNKKGPFYSYFMFKKKPIRIISLLLQKSWILDFQKDSSKKLFISNLNKYKLLTYYYLRNNPSFDKEYQEFLYLKYKNLHDLLRLPFQTNLFNINNIGNLWKEDNYFFNKEILVNKVRIWKKYRKIKPKQRFIFRKYPYALKTRLFFTLKKKNRIYSKKKKLTKNKKIWI